MQQFSLCFGKVKNDCLKFIKSQETKADKFKNKERMIKSFLIPLCFWISKKADKKRPYFVGLAGGQGTGKTTISSLIKIILIKELIVVLPVPCPPANPTKYGFFLSAFLWIQKHNGIKKDLIILSLFLNLSAFVS